MTETREYSLLVLKKTTRTQSRGYVSKKLKRGKLGARVLAGELTVGEARAMLGRSIAQRRKVESEPVSKSGVPYNAIEGHRHYWLDIARTSPDPMDRAYARKSLHETRYQG